MARLNREVRTPELATRRARVCACLHNSPGAGEFLDILNPQRARVDISHFTMNSWMLLKPDYSQPVRTLPTPERTSTAPSRGMKTEPSIAGLAASSLGITWIIECRQAVTACS